MRFLQPSLSSTASRASAHVSSSILRSPRMVSGRFFLGLPLPLFRPGVQFNTCLAFLFALFLLLEIFYSGGSQARRGTLLLYPGLGQAQILHVDSTCKTCGG